MKITPKLKSPLNTAMISLLCVAQACGPMGVQNQPQTGSELSSFAFEEKNKRVYFYYALNDEMLGEDFTEYQTGTDWLRLVSCSYVNPSKKAEKLSFAIEEQKDRNQFKNYHTLSQFKQHPNCSVEKTNLVSLIKPENLSFEKITQPFKMTGNSGLRRSGITQNLMAGVQTILMPLQTITSVLWGIYIFQMVKNDAGGSISSITHFINKWLIRPVWGSLKLIGGALTFDSLALEKFFMTAAGETKTEFYTRFLERLSHPKQQAFYAEDMAREFSDFIKANRSGEFIPDVLKNLDVDQFRAILGEKEASKKLMFQLSELRKNQAKSFDLGWFKTKNEWLISNSKLPLFKNAKPQDLDNIDEWIDALKVSRQTGKKFDNIKDIERIYSTLRPRKMKLGNRLIMIAAWFATVHIVWKIFEHMVRSEEKDIIQNVVKKEFKVAIASTNQSIKNSSECTNDIKEALDFFDRKKILQTVVNPQCGNLIGHLNANFAEKIEMVGFKNTDSAKKALDGIRIILNTVPEIYEVGYAIR